MAWLVKYLASFTKNDWNLDDYPIRFREQKVPQDNTGHFRVVPWIAQIDRWPQMQGSGDTKEHALNDLRKHFERCKAEKHLPRPGTGLPLEFASTRYIDAYADIAREVLKTLYDIDYDDCFISDESTLWDFEELDSLEHAVTVIRESFGADITDIPDGNLVDVFERIRVTRKAASHRSTPGPAQ